MSKTFSTFAGATLMTALLITVLFGASVGVYAQTTSDTSMPVLYNSSGSAVNNTSGSNLSAGWYYTSNGNQVYYYGNGTYYDPSTGSYGGSVSNPSGMSGYVYPASGTTGVTGNVGTSDTTGTIYTTPGVPNTGAGGEAGMNWAILGLSALVAVGGVTYMSRRLATVRS